MKGDTKCQKHKQNNKEDPTNNASTRNKIKKTDPSKKSVKTPSRENVITVVQNVGLSSLYKMGKEKLTPSKSEYKNRPFSIGGKPLSNTAKDDFKSIPNVEEIDIDVRNGQNLFENIIDEFANCDDSWSDQNVSVISCDLTLSSPDKKTPTKNKKRKRSLDTSELEAVHSTPVAGNINKSIPKSHNKNLNEIGSLGVTKTIKKHLPGSVNLLILKPKDLIHIHGIYELEVLHGEIEVLGYKIDKTSEKQKVYSLRGSSLLYLKNITKNHDENLIIRDLAKSLSKIPKDVTIQGNCCVLLYKKLNDVNIKFLDKHVPQQLHCQVNDVLKPKEGTWNYIKFDENWNKQIDLISCSTKLVICGGKSVGKSTFLRYAINRLLPRFKKVRVVDLDPGQPEFTVPGCLSIITVTEPLFGVSYTHLKRPEKSILSSINIAYEPQRFLQNVQSLLSHLTDKSIPTLFNYMGYTHGLGINILAAVLYLIKPTDVLQISSNNPKQNFKHLLNPAIVQTHSILFGNISRKMRYKLHSIESMCTENNGWIADPRNYREMSILSYFGRKVNADDLSIYCPNLHPFEIELNALALVDENGEILHPAAVNANLVSLCYLDNPDSTNVFTCLGWGIVQGLDVTRNILVLITPEELDILDKVTHLVLNSGVMLPPSVYMTRDKIHGVPPYLISGDLTFFGELTKRSHLSVKKSE